MTPNPKREAIANLAFLKRVFSIPEHDKATLVQLEKKLSENLNEFLTQSKVAGEISIDELAIKFLNTTLPETPRFVSDHVSYLLKDVIPYCVNTGSPKFIGHMTSAIPYFLHSLSKCMVALHQNVVKIETSRSFTFLERQTLGILHRLVYQAPQEFYDQYTHHRHTSLGLQCSGGTIANVTALWVARNKFIHQILGHDCKSPNLIDAIRESGYHNLCIFVSQRGHYSLQKAADLLGIGKHNLINIPVQANHKINFRELKKKYQQCLKDKIYPLAVVGIAGTTETGNIDPLIQLADFCDEKKIHFHVDAAWGGAVLFSNQYKHLLKGIERADSVVIDGHKQLYLPMGIGMLLFKDPNLTKFIEQQTNYIIRKGSFDLGKRNLEGSRAGMALLAHSALHILGKKGYEILIDQNIYKSFRFSKMIEEHTHFEIISSPELNILTYRFIPHQASNQPNHEKVQQELSELNTSLQKHQREKGISFVSRTTFRNPEPDGPSITVLRVVLANPHTEEYHLEEILEEQCDIGFKLLNDKTKYPLLNRESQTTEY